MTSLPQLFLIFLRLGCIAFGGPTAHLAYFHAEFVERRRWLSDSEFADLIALCQFLPGPASSQVGLSIGLLRAGRWGALIAWAGFTLPSALILTLLAIGITQAGTAIPQGVLTGLKLVAAAVVAKAVWTLARKLCPTLPAKILALCALGIILAGSSFAPLLALQIGVIVLAALAGLLWLRPPNAAPSTAPQRAMSPAPLCLTAFFVLLAALPVLAHFYPAEWLQITDRFYRTGAMVFGGGHVVLPLLQAQTVAAGWIENNLFLAGYGATQAVPGPLFTFSAFLGGAIAGPKGALIALGAIYLPSFLLIFGVMPLWQKVSQVKQVRRALFGVNAAVTGLLAAALWNPVLTQSVFEGGAFFWQRAVFALVALVAITVGKLPPWLAVLASSLIGGFIF